MRCLVLDDVADAADAMGRADSNESACRGGDDGGVGGGCFGIMMMKLTSADLRLITCVEVTMSPQCMVGLDRDDANSSGCHFTK